MCLLLKGYSLLCWFLACFPSLEGQQLHAETAEKQEQNKDKVTQHLASNLILIHLLISSGGGILGSKNKGKYKIKHINCYYIKVLHY